MWGYASSSRSISSAFIVGCSVTGGLDYVGCRPSIVFTWFQHQVVIGVHNNPRRPTKIVQDICSFLSFLSFFLSLFIHSFIQSFNHSIILRMMRKKNKIWDIIGNTFININAGSQPDPIPLPSRMHRMVARCFLVTPSYAQSCYSYVLSSLFLLTKHSVLCRFQSFRWHSLEQ